MSKTLVIGAGAGRDIASALLVAESLPEDTEVDLAGFLPPWGYHTFDGEEEQPINHLPSKLERFKGDEERRSFEAQLPELVENAGIDIQNYYLFSLRQGTEKLRAELKKLATQYDQIIAVDVGGDILARKQDLPEVLTPIVDLSCLEVLAGLPVKKQLAVVAPGVDGELSADTLEEVFNHYSADLQGVQEYDAQSPSYQAFDEVNQAIDNLGGKSNTVRIIRAAVTKTEGFTDTLYRNGEEHPVQIQEQFMNRIFYFDLDGVYKKNGIGLHYETLEQADSLLREQGAQRTELDLG